MGDAIGRGSEHLRRGQVHKPGVESSDDVRILKLSPPVEVGVVLPGELHEVDAGHGVVHHEVQGPLNAAVHVGPGRQVKNHLGIAGVMLCSAPSVLQSVFTITKKAPTRAFSWLIAATTAFTFKTLLRHYAKRALTPRSLNVKLGPY